MAWQQPVNVHWLPAMLCMIYMMEINTGEGIKHSCWAHCVRAMCANMGVVAECNMGVSECNIGIVIHVNPERKFRGPKWRPAERSETGLGRGSGGPAPEIKKNLYCKWCNLRYFGAIFVNTISQYYNKTCIKRKLNYA